MLKYLLLGIILTLPNVFSEKFRFDNYTLYKVLPKNVEHIRLLQNLHDNDRRFDFWTDPVPSAKSVSILTSPENKNDLEGFMKNNNMDFEIANSNIQEAIDKQTVGTYSRSTTPSMTWDRYYTLDDINAWIDDLAAAYPDIVTVLIGGGSYEGRQIKGFKISHGEGKTAIFLEGGIHSREWISPATVTYIANELLTSNTHYIMEAARDYDWYIFPVTNPDGYVWTHEEFRLWRKNRRPVKGAIGVDLNRNWDNNWLVAGASTDPETDSYAGPAPFSEPESRTLSTFLSSIGDKIDMYLSFHSFSELLLLPYGNSTEPLANYHDAINIGRRAMGALSVRYGTQYVTGNIAEAIYLATGGSIDWVKEELQVPLVYCYELRDDGTHGFLLPPEQILPNNLEVMDSLMEILHQSRRFGYLTINAGQGVQASFIVIAMALLAKLL